MSPVIQLSTAVALLGDSNDPTSTRNVYLLAAALALLGIGLIVVTVWFWRNTRHDPDLLGPLEVMGTRRFRKSDDVTRRHAVDDARPSGARPLKERPPVVAPPVLEKLDLSVARSPLPANYDDLSDRVEVASAAGSPSSDEADDDAASDGGADEATALGAHEHGVDGDGSRSEASEPAGDPEEQLDQDSSAAQPSNASRSGTSRSDDSPAGGTRRQPEQQRRERADGRDVTGEAERDEFAILDAIRRAPISRSDTPRGDGARPFVVVPVDHELPSRASIESAADQGAAEDEVDEPVIDKPSAGVIDPLLRRRDG